MMKGITPMGLPWKIVHRCTTLLPLVFLLLAAAAAPVLAGACEDLSPASENLALFGVDYRPRIGFQPVDAEVFGAGEPLPESLPATLSFPLYAYNLHGDLLGARFRILSSARILQFVPEAALVLTAGNSPVEEAGIWRDDIQLLSFGLAGPLLLGFVEVEAAEGADGVWVDLAGKDGAPLPEVNIDGRGALPAVSPHHGAFAGADDPYHCQPALCPEPLPAILDLEVLESGFTPTRLSWTAGEGNYTMIRFLPFGIHPHSVYDGELLVLMPTVEGGRYNVIHSTPDVAQYWYTAFNVEIAGGEVVLGSQIETGSMVTAIVDESIPADTVTWGAVKQQYR